MNSKTRNPEQLYSEQLSDFEGQLKHTMDDSSLLQDVHRAIRELLREHRSSEADIRKILLAQLDDGSIRQESYQLVRTMLDRIVTDAVDTLPGFVDSGHPAASELGETDVIPGPSSPTETAEDQLQIGSVLRDRFLLQERVAGGSMGVVYKALDRRLAEADTDEPWVAIKVLSPKLSRNGNALRALQQEAAKGRCLTHPNIVRFLDLDRDDEVYFIVMEWLDGRSLAEILDDASSKKLDLEVALDIVGQLGAALDYAHRCGVVHADVKPANVMIVASGQVKLFDFGVARIRQKQSETVTKFDPAVLGAVTPAYSSMQVLTGDEPVSTDDVFSLACLFYRMVAGYRVFGPRNAAEAAESGMEPQRLQELNESQWKALKKALGYSRVARYASIQEFVDDLKADRSDTTAPMDVGEPLVDSEPDAVSGRWPVAIAGLGLIAVLAWLGTQTNLLHGYLPGAMAPASSETASGVSDENMPDPRAAGSSNGLSQSNERLDPVSGELNRGAERDNSADATIELPATEQASDIEATGEAGLGVAGSAAVSVTEPGLAGAKRVFDIEETSPSELPTGQSAVSPADELNLAGKSAANSAPDQESVGALTQPEIVAERVPGLLPPRAVEDSAASRPDPAAANPMVGENVQAQANAHLPPNTVVFWLDRVTVRESDPAVQIDVLRLNPDGRPYEIEYSVRDIDASEGADYFAPGNTTLFFAANQTSIRVLIPLVQDALIESDEAFMLEIQSGFAEYGANINRHITVMIQDDDIAAR